MAEKNQFGKAVKAYPLNGGGPLVGFFIEGSDDKDTIQVGDTAHYLAYREPGDYDNEGANGTYCHI